MTTLQKKNLNTWMNRFVAWLIIFISFFVLSFKAYAADIQMGSGGNLVFEPNEISISAGDTVTFTNGDLPPHNMQVADHPELSHGDLAFTAGESFDVTFPDVGDYDIQCDPHAGAGMKGVIHVS
jgi:plastocyanin